ncbi:HAD family hydrolase [Haladaptatus sp. DYSN1]|uniref:HAD family hydrolase n=1 Tax=unclassified Haladaptatus TaxID=2622732 RepID=UPI002405A765|nr:HAD family hydrolase [Haladaptatus sp. DYSN1]
MEKALYFDLDGTLLQFDGDYQRIVTDAFERTVGRCEPEWHEIRNQAFFDAFENFDPNPYEAGMAAVTEHANLDESPETLAAAWLDCEIEATKPARAATDILDALSETHRLGVLTNGVTHVQKRKLARHGLDEYLDAVVCSYDVGAHKPDPAMFETARDRLPAEAYVMVGDDKDADMRPAVEAGFMPIFVDSGAELPVEVRGLDGLAALVGVFG